MMTPAARPADARNEIYRFVITKRAPLRGPSDAGRVFHIEGLRSVNHLTFRVHF